MLNKFIVLTLMTGLLSTAYANEGRFTFLQENELSPFMGTLFNPEATARILAQTEFLKEEYDLKMAYELSAQDWAHKLELEQMQITLDTQERKYESIIDLKSKEIEQLNKIINKKPGPNAIAWGIVGGFIIGAASTVAIAQATNK